MFSDLLATCKLEGFPGHTSKFFMCHVCVMPFCRLVDPDCFNPRSVLLPSVDDPFLTILAGFELSSTHIDLEMRMPMLLSRSISSEVKNMQSSMKCWAGCQYKQTSSSSCMPFSCAPPNTSQGISFTRMECSMVTVSMIHWKGWNFSLPTSFGHLLLADCHQRFVECPLLTCSQLESDCVLDHLYRVCESRPMAQSDSRSIHWLVCCLGSQWRNP